MKFITAIFALFLSVSAFASNPVNLSRTEVDQKFNGVWYDTETPGRCHLAGSQAKGGW